MADITVPEGLSHQLERIVDGFAGLGRNWLFECPTSNEWSPTATVAELVETWSLAVLNHVRGFLTASGNIEVAERRYRIWLGFHDPALTAEVLELAARLVHDFASDTCDVAGADASLDAIFAKCRLRHPDYQARILMLGAEATDVPWQPAWGQRQFWQFGWGARSRVFFETMSNDDGALSLDVTLVKDRTKAALRRFGVPTPDHVFISNEADLAAAVGKIGFPCVTKPLDLGGGKGISSGLSSIEDVQRGYAYARRFTGKPILLERFVPGDDHRILVIDGRVFSCGVRKRPVVTGDGKRTIAELVEAHNADLPRVRLASSGNLKPILVDEAALDHLEMNGRSLGTVLAAGETATVRGNCNVSTGGSFDNSIGNLHPETRATAELIARTMRSRVCGLDYITTDISLPSSETDGAFIEVNMTPGVEDLERCGHSEAEVGARVLGKLPGRIPLDIVIVGEGLIEKAKVWARMECADMGSGWATHDEAGIDGVALTPERWHPWSGVAALLSINSTERALVIADAARVMRYGLPVDKANRLWIVEGVLNPLWTEVCAGTSKAALWQGNWEAFQRDWPSDRSSLSGR
ncbi:MAG: hypothetical protein KDE55_05770 [Novosphingobium sp.]|nr:hypothetical protein [Novosphingobium sp.]